MKRGRATGIDEVRVEMLVMVERVGVRWTRRLLNTCLREGKIIEVWRTRLIRCFKPTAIHCYSLLFIAVVEVTSTKTSTSDILRKLLYSDCSSSGQ